MKVLTNVSALAPLRANLFKISKLSSLYDATINLISSVAQIKFTSAWFPYGCERVVNLLGKLYSCCLPDREASLIKKEYCRCGPHPLQVISSRARPYLLRERATLAAFSRISGVGHSGS